MHEAAAASSIDASCHRASPLPPASGGALERMVDDSDESCGKPLLADRKVLEPPRTGSQSDIETRVVKPPKGNSIKVRRSAAEASSRDAKIFVETANRFLSYQADRRIPVFP